MKSKGEVISTVVIIVCVLALVLVVLNFVLSFFGTSVFDLFLPRNAKVGGDFMKVGDKQYVSAYGVYSEGRTVSLGEDGWRIKAVKEDPSRTFLVARSFLDQFLYVDSGYDIPTEGKITKAAWGGTYIENGEFISAVTALLSERKTNYTYETEAEFSLTETQRLKQLVVAFEDCPIATESKGWLGVVDGKWVITTVLSNDFLNEDGSRKVHPVECYFIPEKYIPALERCAPASVSDNAR